jgi:DNA-binding MarR family transcriptional regulator
MKIKLRTLLTSDELPLGYRVGYLSNVFSGPVYADAERRFGIQRPLFATLYCTAHLDDLTATDVCTMSGISKKTISRAVTALEKKNLIRRRPNPTDSRSALLRITPAGRRTYQSILPMLQARQQAMLSPLTEPERRSLRALLDKLIDREDGWLDTY